MKPELSWAELLARCGFRNTVVASKAVVFPIGINERVVEVMDHKVLLKKYMQHVCDNEGVTFAEAWERADRFTDDEWKCLRDIDEELYPDLEDERERRKMEGVE